MSFSIHEDSSAIVTSLEKSQEQQSVCYMLLFQLATRAAERELKESRHECAMLRQK